CAPTISERGQAHDDARRAEAALAAAGGTEGVAPRPELVGGKAGSGGDGPAGNPAQRRHTRHARLAVDEHRAAPALALGAASVLGREVPEAVAERLEQRDVLVLDLHLDPVDRELQCHVRTIRWPAVSAGLSRRELLVATAGLVVATACSKGKSSSSSGGTLAVVQASAQLLSGTDQRVAIGVFNGQKPVDQGAVTLRFGRNPTALS